MKTKLEVLVAKTEVVDWPRILVKFPVRNDVIIAMRFLLKNDRSGYKKLGYLSIINILNEDLRYFPQDECSGVCFEELRDSEIYFKNPIILGKIEILPQELRILSTPVERVLECHRNISFHKYIKAIWSIYGRYS